MSVNLRQIPFLVTGSFSVIGNSSLLSDVRPWENSTDVVRFWGFLAIFIYCSWSEKVLNAFIVIVSAAGECHLGYTV